MKRRSLLAGAAALAAAPLARPHAQRPVTVRWWYHFDDPPARRPGWSPISKRRTPTSRCRPSDPLGRRGDYDTRLYTSLIAAMRRIVPCSSSRTWDG